MKPRRGFIPPVMGKGKLGDVQFLLDRQLFFPYSFPTKGKLESSKIRRPAVVPPLILAENPLPSYNRQHATFRI